LQPRVLPTTRTCSKKTTWLAHDNLQPEQVWIETERDVASAQAKLGELDTVLLSTRRQKETLTADTAARPTRCAARSRAGDSESGTGVHQDRRSPWPAHAGRTRGRNRAATGGAHSGRRGCTYAAVDAHRSAEQYARSRSVRAEQGYRRRHAGQDAQIKIETFSFTKYGILHGKVLHVSNDAIQDDARQFTSPRETTSPANADGPQPRNNLVYVSNPS
jgi:hemolysin D